MINNKKWCPQSVILEHIHIFVFQKNTQANLFEKEMGFKGQSIKEIIKKNKYHYWELTGDL